MPFLAFLALAAVIGIFIVPALLTRREGYRRAQDYFVSSDHVFPRVIQNSCIAYAIGLATFGHFFAWGARGDFWPAIIHAAFFGLGLTLLYALRRPMLKFLGRALATTAPSPSMNLLPCDTETTRWSAALRRP